MLLALISPDSLTLSPQEFAFCTYYSMETAPVQLINDYLFFFLQTQQLPFGAHQKPMICPKKIPLLFKLPILGTELWKQTN